MRRALRSIVLISQLLLTACAGSAPTAAQVRVDGGIVGAQAWNGSMLFRGIPFAAPPLGPLRWRPPQPVMPWSGVRQSLEQPASCPQNDYGWNHGDFTIGDEDCLTLDVRTPSLGGKLPVLVWIHGGSNRAGGPNDIVLSDVGKKVVIVGIRYRLGILGFLSHPGLTGEQGTSGNYGLMDQLAALRWVQRNIAKFGGDPNNVTIAGESAGSEDVSLMLAAPAARRLFRKAIMESGTPGFGMPFRSLADAERIGRQADALLGADGDVSKLRRASLAALLIADLKLHDDALESDDYVWLRITVDGRVLPKSPADLLRDAPAKPVIVGSNRIELEVPGGRNHRDAFVAKAFGAKAALATAYYRMDRPDAPDDPRFGSLDQQIGTDVNFRCPAAHFAQIMAAKGAPVWRYEFDAAADGGKTSHAAEIPYAFGDAKLAGGLSLTPYWLNFIRSGEPNGSGVPQWPRFMSAARKELVFSDSGVGAQGPVHPQICAMLDNL
ncbi:MAG: carboxylesterase/lipase family protein [Sphingomicrobium sp.]